MIHVNDLLDDERDKYSAIWSQRAYHDHSPGLEDVDRFWGVVKPEAGYTLLDIGCGAGLAGLELSNRGLNVQWLDIIADVLHPSIDRKQFIQAPVWSSWSTRRSTGWDYGYCVDVMEHLPTEYVALSLFRIVSACRTSWITVSFLPDNLGQLIGQKLHLTVRSFEWWRDIIGSIGKLADARDLCGRGVFVVKR